MGQVLLTLVVALTVAAVVFGVTVLVSGRDPGLAPAEPDGSAVPLPGNRPLRETDVGDVRFDTALRGYRMTQVDQAMRRAAYDIGYKSELIGVLEAEVTALREGRTADAEALRRAREQAAGASTAANGVVSVPGAAPAPAAGQPAVGPVTVTAADSEPAAGRPTPAGGVPANGAASTAPLPGDADGAGQPRFPDATASPADADGTAPAGGEPTEGAGRPGPVVPSESA
ncbi:DivIVA domain-containing protein [Micromonospora sp. WMMD812]|uniref:DivIVA domain-containing protein n=1 Tax=Micromonospora sp. WMMD812 TaxID=3015152 RepID=UPI00248AF8B5|nr:DivIVA domain-containing protein [Micromonospora sp. WMMD812]WBB65186.1 DivIVA domain-containing protein [Micromonospora sp. WMMD812]